MVPAQFRLDTVAVHLLERLEGVRRSYVDRPAEAEEAFARITAEVASAAAAESREYVDDSDHAAFLERELRETFLPRYARLALEYTRFEAAGFHAWRAGDPLARVVTTIAALVAVFAVTRVLRAPPFQILWVLAVAVGFLPEIRTTWYRRRYRAELQSVVDDLGRIQDHLDVYQPSVEPAPVAATDASLRLPSPRGVQE